jgi:hypothetical protein
MISCLILSSDHVQQREKYGDRKSPRNSCALTANFKMQRTIILALRHHTNITWKWWFSWQNLRSLVKCIRYTVVFTKIFHNFSYCTFTFFLHVTNPNTFTAFLLIYCVEAEDTYVQQRSWSSKYLHRNIRVRKLSDGINCTIKFTPPPPRRSIICSIGSVFFYSA